MTTIREALELTNVGLRVFLAKMVLEADDEPVTVEGIMRLTGLGKSTVYRGRSELNDRFPTPGTGPKLSTRRPQVEDGDIVSNDQGKHEDVVRLSTESTAPTTTRSRSQLSLRSSRAETVSDPGLPIPLWRQAVMAKMTELTATGRVQSYNLAADVYLPAYSELSDVRECIALAVDYVETLDDEELNPTDRALVAMLIRKFGKIGLYGLDVALGVTDEDTGRDRFRYARQVAARKLEELRAGRAARESADPSETAT